MFNKKIYIILLLFMVSICTISAASASENVTDTVAIDDANSDDVVTSFNEDSSSATEDTNIVTADNEKGDDSSLSATESNDDVLGGTAILASQYTVDLNDNGYDVSFNDNKKITFNIKPYQIAPMNAYNLYLAFYQVIDANYNLKLVKESGVFSDDTASARAKKTLTYTFANNALTPGLYVIKAINSYDKVVMDSTLLRVKGTATISASNYNSYYNSGTPVTLTLTDKNKKALQYVIVTATFNGQTNYYLTDSQGKASFVPSLKPGTYSVTFAIAPSFSSFITASSVKKTMTIKKAPVTITALDVSSYKECNMTFKATVKSQGKDVNEGKVKVKVAGKEYTADVKNGVATKSIKLGKVQNYTYSMSYLGTDNYDKADSAPANAENKKRSETVIIVSNQKFDRGSKKSFHVTVKTKDGRLVKSGKVTILDSVNVNSKGKAKFYAPGDLNYVKQVGNTVYFKKKVTKTYTVKYTPKYNAFKSSTTKMKITMVYKCTACGSKKTHSHNGMKFVVS